MQWDGTAFGGFSNVDPWLPLADDFQTKNVASSQDDKSSLYWLYRRLIAVRRAHGALKYGAYRPIVATGDLLLYFRESTDERFLVGLNMGSQPTAITFKDSRIAGTILLSSTAERDGEVIHDHIDFQGHEALLIKLDRGSAA